MKYAGGRHLSGGGARFLFVRLLALLIAVTVSAPGCTYEPVSPVLAWVYYPDEILTPAGISVEPGAGDSLDVVWSFEPHSQGVPFTNVTVVFLSRTNPNWKNLVIRDSEALINHMVQPEADYLSTGGDRRAVLRCAELRELYAAGQSLVANYVTFIYPTEIPGFSRPAGMLTIRHSLSPLTAKAVDRQYILGMYPGVSRLEFTSQRGVTASQSNASNGNLLLLSHRSYVYYWLAGASAFALLVAVIAVKKRR